VLCRSGTMARGMLQLVLFFACLANVQAAQINKLTYVTSVDKTAGDSYSDGLTADGTHTACSAASSKCIGGFERHMLPNTIDATYVIPQVIKVELMYEGDHAGTKWVSLVEKAGATPCAGANAAAVADNTHSGPEKSDANKLFTVQKVQLLDASRTFTMCYCDAAHANCQATTTLANLPTGNWLDSGITFKVSKIESVVVYGRTFKTAGTIPNHASLTMAYTGSVLNGRWISFVDSSLNSADPCARGTVAAAPLDSAHSGSMQATASSKIFTANTAALSATKVFAVCYTESGGISSSQWRDSGIRVRRSMIVQMEYGVDITRFGDGFMRPTFNRNTANYNGIATDTFPQSPGAKLRYNGELPTGSHISLVAQGENWDDPCGKPAVAAAAAGSAKAAADGSPTGGAATDADKRLYTGKASAAANSKVVSIAQATGNLLDHSKVFAVCYATGDGSATDSSWADSYARFKISKIESLTHHSVEHTTTGVLPRTGAAVTIEGVTVQTKVDIGYKGSLAAGANTRVSFVNAAQNSVATNGDGVAINQPCIVEANAEATAGATASGALPLHSSGTKKIIVDVDTTGLNSGTIGAANAFTPYIFAVCYSEDGTAWYDSGIRVTVGKMTSIEHGIVAAPSFSERPMYPTLKMMDGTDQRLPLAWTDGGAGNLFGLGLSHGISSARNVLPQTKQTVIHYKTDVGAALGTGRFMSLVNAELNGYKPCYRESAAALADNHHSGAILSTGGALHTITIPQDTLLDHTKVFAVCYAITDGTTADTSWADSYVRVTISKVDSITSIGVTHKVNKYDDQIASRALQIDKTTDYGTLDIVTGLDTPHNNKLDIDYAGTLGTSAKFALVDDWQNGGFPCATYTKAGGVNLASTAYAGDNKDGITNFDGPTKTASGYTTGEIAGYSDQKNLPRHHQVAEEQKRHTSVGFCDVLFRRRNQLVRHRHPRSPLTCLQHVCKRQLQE
jgi:hypothetical protein